MDKFCEERSSWPSPRIKLIIDIERDYYEMLKYSVKHGQDYKTFEIIANGIPYGDGPQGEWIDYSEDGYVECPICGHLTTCEDNIDELHYCWNCGAKMQKGGAT